MSTPMTIEEVGKALQKQRANQKAMSKEDVIKEREKLARYIQENNIPTKYLDQTVEGLSESFEDEPNELFDEPCYKFELDKLNASQVYEVFDSARYFVECVQKGVWTLETWNKDQDDDEDDQDDQCDDTDDDPVDDAKMMKLIMMIGMTEKAKRESKKR